MDHEAETFVILDDSLWHLTKSQDLGSRLTKLQEIALVGEQIALTLGFPELEALVSKDGRLALLRDV